MNGTDWFEEARSVPAELLRECPGWISKQRKDAEERGRQPLTAQLQNGHPAIDPATLKQPLAYDIVTSHDQSFKTSLYDCLRNCWDRQNVPYKCFEASAGREMLSYSNYRHSSI